MRTTRILLPAGIGLLLSIAALSFTDRPTVYGDAATVAAHDVADGPVVVRPFNDHPSPAFAALARRPEFQPFSKYLVIVTNTGSKPITALTLLWASGSNKPLHASVDRYATVSSIDVVPPSSEALFWPTGNMREDVAQQYIKGSSHILRVPGSQDVKRWNSNGAMIVDLDCVVFEDGEVYGLDTSHTVQRLVGQRKASLEVAGQIQSAMSQGKDITEALAAWSPIKVTEPDDSWRQFYTYQVIAQLRKNHNPTKQLVLLGQLPALPLFHLNKTR